MLINVTGNTIQWKNGERLHHLFENRCDQLKAAGRSDHLAVISTQGSFSFQQLEDRSNQVAQHLRDNGVGTGDRIGILFGNSFETYVALLAILKADAAYVPLDANFPAERINFILQDSGVKLIVSTSSYQDKLQSVDLPIIMLDEDSAKIDYLPTQRVIIKQTNDDQLAYVIYTSGTTGNPKGVAIDHSSICNFVQVAANTYGYDDKDRVYQGMTIAFDFSVEELWVPLIVGAALVPAKPGASLVGFELHEFLLENKVTAMCCVPTLLATIENDLPDLRLLLVSGEACPHDLVVRWHSEDRKILNAYGPTEATVTATITELHPGKPVTIGVPLPTYTIVILDPEEDKIVDEGASGEIGIAGIGLAREYLNHQDLTREKFIPDFLNLEANPSGRIYRSGDLGRITDEGEIEYQGRIDTQVKIRGYRIELTEIESAILRMQGVAQAAVDVQEITPGAKELVAYYSLKSGASDLDHDLVVKTLRDQLPCYMVPSYYEHLDVVPMTPSNKTDRKNLPLPKSPRHSAKSKNIVEAKSAMEIEIGNAFSTIMQIDQISIVDNFFSDLGAHSLLMAQFCAKLRQEQIGLSLSMRDVYKNPSVQQLAKFLDDDEVVGNAPFAQIDPAYSIPAHVPSRTSHFACGAFQLATYITSGIAILWILLTAFHWIADAGDNIISIYARIFMSLSAIALGSTVLSIAAKWLLIGRWTKRIIPIWSMQYFRFWLVKYLGALTPMKMFMGGPVYNAYLRMLGAKIGKGAVIFSPAPICTDLFEVGANSLIKKGSNLNGYFAKGNNIVTGSIKIGDNSFVGSSSVLSINTIMEDNSQLGHSSTLLAGNIISQNKNFHGTPAEETSTNYCNVDEANCSTLRRWTYASILFFTSIIVTSFVLLGIFEAAILIYQTVDVAALAGDGFGATFAQILPTILTIVAISVIGSVLLSVVLVHYIPKLLNKALEPNKTYVLFGVHYFIQKTISLISNLHALNILFGDSSLIVHYLSWVGYNLNKVVQTGANFGLDQVHENPLHCDIGSQSMVSDGLKMDNIKQSATSFSIGKVTIGDKNYLGNNIYYPTGGKTGSNILIATKAMIPLDGEIRENVGLLGSPCFEIPRASTRDRDIVEAIDPALLKANIKRKNIFNLTSMGLLLIANWLFGSMIAAIAVTSIIYFPHFGFASLMFAGLTGVITSFAFWLLMEKTSLKFGKLKKQTVSMYDDYFLFHERHWKFTAHPLDKLFAGTPFKPMLARAMGANIGKMVFDDGAEILDKTLMSIGDNANLNARCIIQGHSLEEGVFKSGEVNIANNCTLETAAFVHYSVEMGENSCLGPNAFLMKGEVVPANSIWQGNPARPVANVCAQTGDKIVAILATGNDNYELPEDAKIYGT